MRAIGCAFNSCLALLLLAALAAIIIAITAIYWRTDGPLTALGILALLLGIAYVWGGWGRRQIHDF